MRFHQYKNHSEVISVFECGHWTHTRIVIIALVAALAYTQYNRYYKDTDIIITYAYLSKSVGSTCN